MSLTYDPDPSYTLPFFTYKFPNEVYIDLPSIKFNTSLADVNEVMVYDEEVLEYDEEFDENTPL